MSSDAFSTQGTPLAKIVGQSIFYSSIQAAIGSVEMSSKFSVMNFSKDQETLQNAADALRNYMYIGTLWALATVLVMYSSYGPIGGVVGLMSNILLMAWIYLSYVNAFRIAAEKYKLQPPKVFC